MASPGDDASNAGKMVAQARDLLSRGGTLESGQGSGPIADELLIAAVQAALLPTDAVGSTSHSSDTALAKRLAAATVVGTARAALEKVQDGSRTANLSQDDVSALELIVQTIGRPAMRYRNGRVQRPSNDLGDNSRWVVLIATQKEAINKLSNSVGRVACDHGLSLPVIGTGWRVGRDLVITNSHVVDELVDDPRSPPNCRKLDRSKSPFIDFAYTDQTSGASRCNIEELLYCSDEQDPVDIAVLRIGPGNAAAPAPIPIDWDETSLGRQIHGGEACPPKFQGSEIYTVGHPYRETATTETLTIFGNADGRKRCAPGFITSIDASLPVLLHDSSTLGGNSGSCVIAIGATGHSAVGLHFGGQEGGAAPGSGLGSTNYAIAFSRLGDHPSVRFLKN